MRNYRELTQAEIDRLEELYPTTTNRELSKMFDISVDAIQDRFAYPNGWKKGNFKRGNRGGKPLDEKSVKWIVKHYQHTKNHEIMDKFGIGESTLHRIARRYGLKKSTQFKNKMIAESSRTAMSVCRKYKVYEQQAEFNRERWKQWKAEGKQVGFRKGESNKDRLSPKRYKAMLEKMAATRRENIRKDRMRINWGLPQKTRIKLVSAGRKAAVDRHRLKKLNYIVERGSTHVYYDELTRRNLTIEKRAMINGLIIEQA